MSKGKKRSYKEFLSILESDSCERKKLFQNLLGHLREGLSIESFYQLETQRLLSFIERYKNEFDDDEIKLAMQEGRDWWERLGKAQASGQNVGNSRAWWYNMAHRYGWSDKVELKAKHEGTLQVQIVNYSDVKDSK